MSNAGRTPPMQVFALSALHSCEFKDCVQNKRLVFVAKCVMCLCIAAALKCFLVMACAHNAISQAAKAL